MVTVAMKLLMLGGIGGRRKRGRQRMRCLDAEIDHMVLRQGVTLGWRADWVGSRAEQGERVREERTSGRSNGTPLQYSCLENPMDRGAW